MPPRRRRWRPRGPGHHAPLAVPAGRDVAGPAVHPCRHPCRVAGSHAPGEERTQEAGQHVAGPTGGHPGVAGGDDRRRAVRVRHHRAGSLQDHDRAPLLRLAAGDPDPVGLHVLDRPADEPGHLPRVRGEDDGRGMADDGHEPRVVGEGVDGVGVEDRRDPGSDRAARGWPEPSRAPGDARPDDERVGALGGALQRRDVAPGQASDARERRAHRFRAPSQGGAEHPPCGPPG